MIRTTTESEAHMEYVAFIGTAGPSPAEALAVMQRDLPAWVEEMDRRSARLFGQELDFPETAVTVRVRDGETLVTDGPFAETKEFVAGFVLLDCADLDEAVNAMGRSPVARFHPIEIRPFRHGLRQGAGTSAGSGYVLTTWVGEAPVLDDQASVQEQDAWRRDLDARGAHLYGGALAGPDTATTVRAPDGQAELSDGPFLDIEAFIGGIDVVRCRDRQQAIELAAAHPVAGHHAIEVRPFHPA
jgi:hypothetical protein